MKTKNQNRPPDLAERGLAEWETRARVEETPSNDAIRAHLQAPSLAEIRELSFPLALIGTALAVFVLVAVLTDGIDARAVWSTSLRHLGRALTLTVFAVAACYIVGRVMGTSFGTIKVGVLKLTAIILFSVAVGVCSSMYSPALGFVSYLVLSLGLLRTLFDLEIEDLIALVLVMAVFFGLVIAFDIPGGWPFL